MKSKRMTRPPLYRSPSVFVYALVALPSAGLTFFASFFCLISFAAAQTPQEVAARGGAPLPEGWEAGVPNQGSYYQWYDPAQHLALVVFCIMLLVTAFALWVHAINILRDFNA